MPCQLPKHFKLKYFTNTNKPMKVRQIVEKTFYMINLYDMGNIQNKAQKHEKNLRKKFRFR